MKKGARNILILGVISLLVLIIYLYFKPNSFGQYDWLARCLTEQNVKMYGIGCCILRDAFRQFGNKIQIKCKKCGVI